MIIITVQNIRHNSIFSLYFLTPCTSPRSVKIIFFFSRQLNLSFKRKDEKRTSKRWTSLGGRFLFFNISLLFIYFIFCTRTWITFFSITITSVNFSQKSRSRSPTRPYLNLGVFAISPRKSKFKTKIFGDENFRMYSVRVLWYGFDQDLDLRMQDTRGHCVVGCKWGCVIPE